uniref:Uncharacterized protein n=1 Tax=viral metagenome TaxID=1070528 RepID=A0A6C0EM13_9ZZZZ
MKKQPNLLMDVGEFHVIRIIRIRFQLFYVGEDLTRFVPDTLL